MVRSNEESKTCILDNLFYIDDNTYLDIEVQSKLSSNKQLIRKNLLYQASVLVNLSVKGENVVYNNNIIGLCIYEGIYKGNFGKGVVDIIDEHMKIYTPTDLRYGLDGDVNQK